ncbi:serine carboxypeptidase [Trypanosoma rangeli]|uniref:Carboxypeptidase n=1 Tax=Trypanosoma rangeli TaxID=5698 RepID=A0A3R7MQS1_TRYRA|nr:serine carboxypeptidase [Trypanosoma rangeli]RNF09772.1 serine carboxypeptidase [Trypanosoma rangeli]|eukprot:RNF09772.1 serine carboxypeptidase [Trypanosoma rangeli]
MSHFARCLLVALLVAAMLTTAVVDALYAAPIGRLREKGTGWRPCDPNVQQWSGYLDIPGQNGDKHYFYWAFGPRNKNPDAPVLLWMTGGPGCSSMLALLVENGPCWVNETTGDLYNNTYSWNNEAYVIYVDQPAGVGFSYAQKTDYDTNEMEVSEDMYHFIQAFFTAHKELQNNEFFVVGESYGGHYAPATAYRINKGNRNHEGLPIRLAGLAIGNGLTDPYTQYAAYPDLVWNWCQKVLGRPCVSESAYELMKSMVPTCQKVIELCNSGTDALANTSCTTGRFVCNPIVAVYSITGRNSYDIRKTCVGSLCYNFDAVEKFLNREDVQKSLGVDSLKWQSCNMGVNIMFAVDWFKNFNYTVPVLLEDGIRVMVYAGDMDFICNWIGNKNWTTTLLWPGKEAFNAATDKPFSASDGSAAGLVRSAAAASTASLSFVQVYNAGHMVPMDQPAAASVMINKFMQNKPLN